jgi:hypothetical protein
MLEIAAPFRMMTHDCNFELNRRWAFFYLSVCGFAILAFAGMFIVCSLALFVALMTQRFAGWFVMLVCMGLSGVALGHLAAFIGGILRILKIGGPALIVSSEGFRYCVACDDLISWAEIKSTEFEFGMGIKLAIRFRLNPRFAETLHWRSRIANSYKPDVIAVRFRLIKASRATVEEALLGRLRSNIRVVPPHLPEPTSATHIAP